MTLPDDLAFLTFFEVEPVMLDPGAPWLDNTLTYLTERDGYVVRFEISPSNCSLKVAISFGGHEVADVELAEFTDLEIMTDGGKETLIARFGESTASALFLTLRPQVRLAMLASSDA
jgi:hypothetical protein